MTEPWSGMRSDYIKPQRSRRTLATKTANLRSQRLHVPPARETGPVKRLVPAGRRAVLLHVQGDTEAFVEGMCAGLTIFLVDVGRHNREGSIEAAQRVVCVKQDDGHRSAAEPLHRQPLRFLELEEART